MRGLSASSDFEEDILVSLRCPRLLVSDMQQMTAILCDMTDNRGEPLHETKALHWFAQRLSDKLGLLCALIEGIHPAPKFLPREPEPEA